MKHQQRLLGIDLVRGIAVFGVVVLHSDSGVEQLPFLWQLIRQLFGFAVPFFLATSFYFAVGKSQQGKLKFALRIKRLLFPYLLWSLFYLLYKASKYMIDGESERLPTLFQDPFALIFCGNAAFHLYFLPLLLWGICLVKILDLNQLKKINLKGLLLCLIISLTISNLIVISGNEFQLISGKAFVSLENLNSQVLSRSFLLLTAWTFWCLPYILISKIIYFSQNHQLLDKLEVKTVNYLVIIFIVLAYLDFWWQPIPLSEVIRGYIALFIGIYFSHNIKPPQWIISLGDCSFGIYLIHLIFVESFYIIGTRFYSAIFQQPSVTLLISITIMAFFFSWLTTIWLLKSHKNTRLIFGI